MYELHIPKTLTLYVNTEDGWTWPVPPNRSHKGAKGWFNRLDEDKREIVEYENTPFRGLKLLGVSYSLQHNERSINFEDVHGRKFEVRIEDAMDIIKQGVDAQGNVYGVHQFIRRPGETTLASLGSELYIEATKVPEEVVNTVRINPPTIPPKDLVPGQVYTIGPVHQDDYLYLGRIRDKETKKLKFLADRVYRGCGRGVLQADLRNYGLLTLDVRGTFKALSKATYSHEFDTEFLTLAQLRADIKRRNDTRGSYWGSNRRIYDEQQLQRLLDLYDWSPYIEGT